MVPDKWCLRCIRNYLQKLKEYENLKKQNKLGKTYFHHGKAYGEFKVLVGRASSDNILPDKPVNTAYSPQYDESIRASFNGLQIFWWKNLNKVVLIGVLPQLMLL